MPQPKKTGSNSSARKPAARTSAASAAKKPAARKPAAKKPAARKPAARSTAAASKPASASARKPAARKPAARKPAARKPAAGKSAPRKPAARSRAANVPTTPEELVANLTALRERLVSSITLTTERLQATVDDAVERGRITRKDAEDLLGSLVTAGRQQTEALIADLEQLLGRGGDLRTRAADSGDAVLRGVDRARRKVGSGSFPILNYEDLSVSQITKRLSALTPAQLRKIRDFERGHDARKTILSAIEKRLG